MSAGVLGKYQGPPSCSPGLPGPLKELQHGWNYNLLLLKGEKVGLVPQKGFNGGQTCCATGDSVVGVFHQKKMILHEDGLVAMQRKANSRSCLALSA